MSRGRGLIIGARPGNVMWNFVERHTIGTKVRHDWRYPSAIDLDVTDTDSIAKYIHDRGPFEELVYAAGYNQLTWIKDVFRDNHIKITFDVNVIGFIDVVSAHMVYYDRAPSRIVAVSSDAAHTAMRGSIAYGASKAALNAAIKNMARELAPESVVVGVAPGMIEDTPMTGYIDRDLPKHRGWTPEYCREYEEAGRPMVRRITKSEVVDTIHFALTGPAMLSGSIIEITGGK